MLSYQAKSFAKINLGLKVLNQRADKFHNINSIFLRVSLCDSLKLIPSKQFYFQCNNRLVPNNEKNTIYKAYKLFKKKTSFNNEYTIILDKQIPLGSGMGGGSSNAAYTLRALNYLSNSTLNLREMMDLGLEIGSDVPFFLNNNKINLVMGRGEILNDYNAPLLNSIFIVLVLPEFSVSTSWAYKKIKNTLDYNKDCPKFPALDGDVDWKLFGNDFEKIVGSTYPEIFEIKELLEKEGALYSSLSGTGSTMFGVYNNFQLAKQAIGKLTNYNTLIVTPT